MNHLAYPDQEHDFGRYWSEALGKPIQVAPNNRQGLDQLEMHVSKGINPMWARDIRLVCVTHDRSALCPY